MNKKLPSSLYNCIYDVTCCDAGYKLVNKRIYARGTSNNCNK